MTWVRTRTLSHLLRLRWTRGSDQPSREVMTMWTAQSSTKIETVRSLSSRWVSSPRISQTIQRTWQVETTKAWWGTLTQIWTWGTWSRSKGPSTTSTATIEVMETRVKSKARLTGSRGGTTHWWKTPTWSPWVHTKENSQSTQRTSSVKRLYLCLLWVMRTTEREVHHRWRPNTSRDWATCKMSQGQTREQDKSLQEEAKPSSVTSVKAQPWAHVMVETLLKITERATRDSIQLSEELQAARGSSMAVSVTTTKNNKSTKTFPNS